MKIKMILDNNDVRELIYDSFCNGGLESLSYSSIKIDWKNNSNKENYDKAKDLLKKDNPNKTLCIEDILTEMFVNNGIYFRDYEDDDDSEYFHFTFDLAKENLANALDGDNSERLISTIQKIIPEYMDADMYDYDDILQTAMYGEVVYG
jgi:hypothetical protein